MGAVEGQERRLLAFNGYGNENGSEVSVVQVHPDPESMLSHMQVAAEHIERATEELLDVGSVQIYGTPNEAVLEMIRQLSRLGGSHQRQGPAYRRVHPSSAP